MYEMVSVAAAAALITTTTTQNCYHCKKKWTPKSSKTSSVPSTFRVTK
jgi:hypothetical protein